jgi:hypothetical protein
MGAKEDGTRETTQKTEPWEKATPYLLGNETKQLKSGVTPIYSSGIDDGRGQYSTSPYTYGDFENYTQISVVDGAPVWEYTGGGGQLMNPESDYETVGNKGILDLSRDLYNSSNWTSGMQGLTDDFYNKIYNVDLTNNGNDLLAKINAGEYDPNLTQVGQIDLNALRAGQGALDPTAAIQRLLSGEYDKSIGDPITDLLAKIESGAYDSNTKEIGQLSLPALRAAQGEVDPTAALKKLLSGEVNMDVLDPINKYITQSVTQNLNENMLASNRSTAIGSGGYGSSRQGIADALATQRANQELSGQLANLYGSAFENAQNRMQTAAHTVDALGADVGKYNAQIQQWNNENEINKQAQKLAATQNLSTSLASLLGAANEGAQNRMYNISNALDQRSVDVANANAQIEQWNNQNELTRQANRLQASLAGQDLNNNMLQQLTSQYNTLMGMQNAENQYNWSNLGNYANFIYPVAGAGGTQTGTQPLYSNTGAGILGGALGGASLGSSLAGMIAPAAYSTATGGLAAGAAAGSAAGPVGAILGAVLGGLSDRRYKEAIRRVGTTCDGLPVYTFKYTDDAPVSDEMKAITFMGVMADEVKEINPDAVITVNGIDYVNYERIE